MGLIKALQEECTGFLAFPLDLCWVIPQGENRRYEGFTIPLADGTTALLLMHQLGKLTSSSADE